MPSRVRLPGAKRVVLPAAVLAALLLAGCSSGESSSAPKLGPTQPAVSPTFEAPAATASPGPLLPGQRPFLTPPSFTLPRAVGGTLSLDDYLGKGPLVVVFYRGFF